MNIQEFVANSESKYAVITLASYLSDPTAQSLTNSPAVINFNDTELVILSIPAEQVQELVAYAEVAGNGVEFELTIGSGKVTLLTHSDAIKLVAQATPEAVDEIQPL